MQIGLKEGAAVQGGRAYRKGGPVLYYGSSITQGGCASRPDNCYPAYISQWTNTDYINLGFSGNGKAEPAMVEYLASLPCRAFVCDYDHNAPMRNIWKRRTVRCTRHSARRSRRPPSCL